MHALALLPRLAPLLGVFHLAASDGAGASVVWTDLQELTVRNVGFPSNPAPFTRLPPQALSDVPPVVASAAQCSSGISIDFQTNANYMFLNYSLALPVLTEVASTQPNGYSGADLYWFNSTDATWRWVAVTFSGLQNAPANHYVVLEEPFYANSSGWPVGPVPSAPIAPSMSRYRLHLPSFNGVKVGSLGVPSGAVLTKDSTTVSKTAVYYGGAAAQGAVTARPGQTFANTFSRDAGVAVVNMGFASGCLLDTATWSWVANVSADMFFIDCGWDSSPDVIATNIPILAAALRKQQPDAWIALVEPNPFDPSWIMGDIYGIAARVAALRAAYQTLQSKGYNNIAYVNASFLYGSTSQDPTFDGTLPMDTAHEVIAAGLRTVFTAPASFVWAGASMAHTSTVNAQVDTALPSCNDQISWTEAPALNIVGRAFNDTPTPYNRLPSAANGVVRSAVWGLSLDSAGLQVAFETSAQTIYIKYSTSGNFEPMVHFSAAGVSGADLFAVDPTSGYIRFVSTANITLGINSFCGPMLVKDPAVAATQYLLYFPTYNQPTSVSVGVPTGQQITAWQPFAGRAPVVWYGTSILQGAAAYRPGGIFTSIISRNINREIYNFGFSGNGWMEITVAEFLVRIPSPAAFIIDCNKNMNASMITSNAVPLVKYLRNVYPEMPIIMTEGTQFGRDFLSAAIASYDATDDAALLQAYTTLVNAGDQHLHYVRYTDLFSAAHLYSSPTAAGLHPTDAGIQDIASFWSGYLPTIIGA